MHFNTVQPFHFLLPDSLLSTSASEKNAFKHCISSLNLIIILMRDAIKAFLNHQYEQFDALTGNNSCELVAYTIFNVVHYQDDDLINYLKTFPDKLKNIQAIIQLDIKKIVASKKKITLKQFLDQKIILCDSRIIWLAMAFACTLIKIKVSQEQLDKTDYKQIINIYKTKISSPLANSTVGKLIRHWQRSLVNFSIEMLRKKMQYHAPETPLFSTKYISPAYTVFDSCDRACLPHFYAHQCVFYSLKLIPSALLAMQIHLVDNDVNSLGQTTFFYQYNVRINHYEMVNISEHNNPAEPVFVFAGCRYTEKYQDISNLSSEFKIRNIKEILDANYAIYPHYPSGVKQKDIFPDEPELRAEFKRLRALPGFSLQDPSDFCLTHIYITSLKHLLQPCQNWQCYFLPRKHHQVI